eukprot:scaffold11532_cov119-Cylindrotheca_fusiformis.AAC.4
MRVSHTIFAVSFLAVPGAAFSTNHRAASAANTKLLFSADPSDTGSFPSVTLDALKDDLVRTCSRSSKPLLDEVRGIVKELEEKAEEVGVGQSSAVSGLLAGEWELLYSPEDVTRSSPFFWAFRKAFPDQSDEIFAITDSIPAPLKEVGPAYQTIELNEGTQNGKLVSQVKVATLNGLATSMMTTRGTITGIVGFDGIRIRVETTKPEDSTAIKTFLGPLGDIVNDSLPPFPSGEVLELVQQGSSEVVMRTTFCDEGLRISRNEDKYDDVYVWRRKGFVTSESF